MNHPLTTWARRALRAALFALPACAAAQGGPLDSAQRTWLQLNVTNARFDSSTGGNTTFSGGNPRIQQERDLGLDERQAMPGVLFGRRIGERFRIEGELVRSQRSGSAVLPSDVTIDGVTWGAGSRLYTDFSLRTTRISGGFSAVLTPDFEFGASFGGQILSVRRSLEGNLSSGGGSFVSDESDSNAQPLLGLYARVQLGPMVRLSGRVDSSIDEDDFVKLDLSATFRPLPNIGIGVGWRYIDARFSNETFFFGYDNFGQLRYRARGPMLLFEASF